MSWDLQHPRFSQDWQRMRSLRRRPVSQWAWGHIFAWAVMLTLALAVLAGWVIVLLQEQGWL